MLPSPRRFVGRILLLISLLMLATATVIARDASTPAPDKSSHPDATATAPATPGLNTAPAKAAVAAEPEPGTESALPTTPARPVSASPLAPPPPVAPEPDAMTLAAPQPLLSTAPVQPEPAAAAATSPATAPTCNRTIRADVVAFDQIIFYNRYGSFDPGGMMYALRRDVVAIDPTKAIGPGNTQLRSDKRPRPLVLRVNEGDCLQVTFTNMLDPVRSHLEELKFANAPDKMPYFGPPQTVIDDHTGLPVVIGGEPRLSSGDSPATRTAAMHVNGLDYVDSIASDGSNVGQNASSLATPGQTRTYKWYAAKQGQYFMFSTAATIGGEGDGGQPDHGLFGSVNVEPAGAKWYRSQVTAAQLKAATKKKTLPNGTVVDDLNQNGTPKINYEAADSSGTPILNMLKGDEIVHTDINAVVAGFSEDCTNAPPSSTCGQAFREFTVIFNDEIEAGHPAFPELAAGTVFHGLRDGFAINYGSAGMGAEVLANRKGVGPAANCKECKLEEFFLESWALGDPAMLVRNDPETGKATETLYPDDPSNVHHSYIGDPVRFRNMHAGPKETHVFHLHAHQWLMSPRDQNSTYLDSQTISPGGSFTYEINYGGGGNRNVGSPGDSIFHCHLYPHFAEGMWELWRNHDVFESGTTDRNLPDGEIAGGTPNPGLVPIPGKPMAPMPTAQFPGYPFYMAGQAGHRAPQPAYDMDWDGGLPRHRIVSAEAIDGKPSVDASLLADPVAARVASRNADSSLFDLARKLTKANIELLPQDGTDAEKVAMNFHAGLGVAGELGAGVATTTRYGWLAKGYPSFDSSGAPGLFLVNGRAPKPGAPYADPCPDSFNGLPVPDRVYKAAYIQFDMPVNTSGWHDRQARVAVLQEDVEGTLNGTRPPEPLFFRANSNDCVTFKATNLIPNNLNLDDFQVFSPTDIMGQHIHLVKFDVTSSDGAGNGWNYEDGTFTAQEVRERIAANNAYQASIGGSQILTPLVHPELGPGPDNEWLGAQTTVQRWWADPLLNTRGEDRTLRTVFSHDHFGPSSHQHHGLYAALVIEPTDSQWTTPSGDWLGYRDDGGPTSYAANILHSDPSLSYREFNLAFADYAIVYTASNIPVNPPNFQEHDLPIGVGSPVVGDPSQQPEPEAISTADPGTQLINYRNEPVALRVTEKNQQGEYVQKTGEAGDVANAFSSVVHGDPHTPILKVYEGDRVQVRLIQGAQEDQHVFNIHGFKWLFEPSAPNSGYMNAQQLGISEHFEFEVGAFPIAGRNIDYLYSSAATGNLWDGQWGLMRGYREYQEDLAPLPNNYDIPNVNVQSSDVCPQGVPTRTYQVSARLARDLLPGGALVYNDRFQIKDPNAILFVNEDETAKLHSGEKKPEPLILRANAGDCIKVTLTNMLPEVMPESNSWTEVPPILPGFNYNQLKTSNRVGLHAQLVAVNTFSDDGSRVGFNDDSTVGPGQSHTYTWYAGHRKLDMNGTPVEAPVEFGATGIRDFGDPIKHPSHGATGSLIIEPQGSTWTPDANSNASADIKGAGGNLIFREFVLMYQDDLSLQRNGVALMNNAGGDDSEDTGLQGFNYRAEPIWARLGLAGPEASPGVTNDLDFTNALSSIDPNTGCGGSCGDPATPVFTAKAGTEVRFRVLHPAGKARQHGFSLFGHHWDFEPWTNDSTVQGHNPYTFQVGSYSGIAPARHLNILTTAGGLFHVPGDYLYRTQESFMFGGGLWGIFRVTQ
jgi:hypothetical protein